MRYPERHKESVRRRIISEAAVVLRQRGIDGVSIPEIMQRAGLTRGSFYCHFTDRDELVGEAVRAAAEETGERIFDSPLVSAHEVVRRYLSKEHRDHPETGCVVAALGAESCYQQAPAVRRAFAYAARGLLRLVQRKLEPAAPPGELGDEALRTAATLVGALILARLVDDDKLSERILRAGAR